jgi:Na+-driven multidrug efflux pump
VPAVACLQDSQTPALAVVLGVLVNIASNFIAVTWLALGLQGAAATTVATQVVGASVLLAVANRSSTLRPALSPLGMSDLRLFAQTMGPLSVTYVCKVRLAGRLWSGIKSCFLHCW